MTRTADLRLTRRNFLSLALAAPGLARSVQTVDRNGPETRFISYDDVEGIVRSGDIPLPAEFARQGAGAIRGLWPGWVARQDAALKARLQRGEEDTLANFVLFGTSFTAQPRLTPDVTNPDEFDARMRARIQNFVDAVATPGTNERLQQLGALITRLGHSAAPGEPRELLAEYVMQNLERYLIEQQSYGQAANKSRQNDTASSLSATSEIFKERGLSVDTDFRPNYAIETALAEVRRRALLRTVRRVAIVGPGLDFTDKDSGFDHYPLQTLQPFAVVDSLLKLGLAKANDLRVSLFDVSEPVLDHVRRAVRVAQTRQPYVLQLVLDRSRAWDRRVEEYWRTFGAKIGREARALPLPVQARDMRSRAMSIRPEIVALMEPVPMNIVLQRVPTPGAFDLVIATNILVYYSAFEQALALANIDAMVTPGGVFLSNDLVREYSAVRLRPAGIVNVNYTPNETDQIRLYARSAFSLQLPPL